MAVSDFRPLLDDEVLPLRRRVARVAGCPASQLLPQRNAILYRPRARPGEAPVTEGDYSPGADVSAFSADRLQ